MKSRIFVGILVVAAFLALLVGLPRVQAQSPLRRVTTTGDVLEFVWSPQGDGLYVTREGRVVELSAARQQVTGDLYRVGLESGAGELLAKRANGTQAPLVGDEIAFTRLRNNGTAQVVVYNPRAKQERAVGEVTFGAVPQWNREGGMLFFVADGKLQRMTQTERGILFERETFPDTVRVSPRGDRAAYVDGDGLWVTQGEKENVARSEGETRVLSQLAWSNDGEKVAYAVTHNGFDPEVWVADTTRHTTKRVARDEGLVYFENAAWSPDDDYLIFTRTPTGSESAGEGEIWRVRADGSEQIALTRNHEAETLPQYDPQGKFIAFMRDGDVWVLELNGAGLVQEQEDWSQTPLPNWENDRVIEAQRTAPATIRVRHDAANTCRSVPVGQIDVIDFETYVKRVVPAEVFSSWDDDALKTQAVAARSYAWFWLLQHGMWAYDVTDSTAYQYMCDTRVASTDNATEATRGQYLDYLGNMMFAAYGAENGDPTLTNTFGNPYLIGVDDPVSFNQPRSGNGIGYSQWGAQRWATQYNWNYQQILLHYYANPFVSVEASATSGTDTTPPIGAVVMPWNGWGIASSKVRIVVNASDNVSGIATIDLRAEYDDGGAQDHVIATLGGADREFVWDVSGVPNQTDIVVTPILHDANGNTSNGASVTFDLDRKKPTGTLGAPTSTTNQTVTLNLNASDAGGSGLTGMAFSNDWEWQGESQSITANSGAVVADAGALNGNALAGLVGTHAAGTWYGPYTNVLPTNQAYRAYFRIKTDDVDMTDEIALLDVVTDNGDTILGVKSVRGTDLQTANVYQELYVDFFYTGFSTNGLELRTAFRDTASLWLDRILVVRMPVAYASSANWTLTNGQGNKRVIGKFVDGAGNVSVDAVATVFFGDNPPPTLVPRGWLPFIIRER